MKTHDKNKPGNSNRPTVSDALASLASRESDKSRNIPWHTESSVISPRFIDSRLRQFVYR
jgi:hypothetical protein